MNDVFKAVADPTRREILLMLVQKPESVKSISKKFQMTRPAISKHLHILADCKLVIMEPDSKDGRQYNCYAQLEALKEIEDYIKQLELFWKTKITGLETFLNKSKQS